MLVRRTEHVARASEVAGTGSRSTSGSMRLVARANQSGQNMERSPANCRRTTMPPTSRTHRSSCAGDVGLFPVLDVVRRASLQHIQHGAVAVRFDDTTILATLSAFRSASTGRVMWWSTPRRYAKSKLPLRSGSSNALPTTMVMGRP